MKEARGVTVCGRHVGGEFGETIIREIGWKFGVIGGEEIEKNGDIYRKMGFLEESSMWG